MKKIFCLIFVLLLGIMLFSCEETHTHQYEVNWTADATHHWKSCADKNCKETVAKAEHSFEVDADGQTENCSVCGEQRLLHTHSFADRWTSDTTQHWHVCTDETCGAVDGKVAHEWGEWITTTEASCVNKGMQMRICVCGAGELREISATGVHVYGNWETVTSATCMENGLLKRICACGAVETYETLATGIHTYDTENICTQCFAYKDSGVVFALRDGYYEVVDYQGSAAEVIIPSAYKGVPVTRIADLAFYDQGFITTLVLPDTITHIGEYAFELCTGLTNFELPSYVTSIGKNAFFGCESIVSLTVPEGVTTIEVATFSGCLALETVLLPSSVTSIDMYAFSGCESLAEIALPDRVSYVRNGAFANCTSLASVTLPQSVSMVAQGVFEGCTSLLSVVLPDGVTSIGYGAFRGCTSLVSIELPGSVVSIKGEAFLGCTALSSVLFENTSVWSVGVTQVVPAELADPATAALYLKSTYCDYDWSFAFVCELSGDTVQQNDHVAAITYTGITYYYTSLEDAIAEVLQYQLEYRLTEVTVLKDTQLSPILLANKTLILRGAVGADEERAIITAMDEFVFALEGDAFLILENLSFVNCVSLVVAGEENPAGDIVIGMTEVSIEFTATSEAICLYNAQSAEIGMSYCVFFVTSGRYALLNVKNAIPNGCDFMLCDTWINAGCSVLSGEAAGEINIILADDISAVALGYTFRIGELEGGTAGEIYFASVEAAFDAAERGVRVYDISTYYPIEVNPSAAILTGDSVKTSKHVAALTYEGVSYYYTSFDTAIAEALQKRLPEITVLKDAQWNTKLTINSSLFIKGADRSVVLTAGSKGHNMANGTSLTFKDLTINVTPNWFDIVGSYGYAVDLAFDGVTLNISRASSANLIYLSYIAVDLTIKDCQFNDVSGINWINIFHVNSGAYVEALSVTDTTFNGMLLRLFRLGGNAVGIGSADAPGVLENVTSNAYELVYVTVGATYLDITGGSFVVDSILGVTGLRLDDGVAAALGYGFRLGDVAFGETGKVYFVTVDEAFAAVEEGQKVYNISSGSPEEMTAPAKDGATTQHEAHVASFTVGRVTYYYTTFDIAVGEALRNGATEVTLLKDATWNTRLSLEKSLTIKGVSRDVVLTALAKGHNLIKASTLRIENLTLDATPNFFDANEPLARTNVNTIVLESVTVNITKVKSCNLFFLSAITVNIEVANCEFNYDGPGEMNIFNINCNTVIKTVRVTNTTVNGENLTLMLIDKDSPRQDAPPGMGTARNPAVFENVTSNSTLLVSALVGSSYLEIKGGSIPEDSITGNIAVYYVDDPANE